MSRCSRVRPRARCAAVFPVIVALAGLACDGSKQTGPSTPGPTPSSLQGSANPADAAASASDAAAPPAPWSRVPKLADAVSLAGFYERVCAVRRTGAVVCWGTRTDAEGETSASLVWTSLAALDPAVGLGGNSEMANLCAVSRAGTVQCLDLDDSKAKPVAVAGIRDAVAVAGHLELSCALGRKGALRCWSPGEEKSGAAIIKGLPALVSMQMFGLETAGIDRKGGLWQWDIDGGERTLVSRRSCTPGPVYLADDPTSYDCAEHTPVPVEDLRGLVLQGGAETMELFHALIGDAGAYAYTDRAWGDTRGIIKAPGGAKILSFMEPFALPADTDRILAASPLGCAVTKAGAVLCWGGVPFAKLPQPAPISRPIALASSGYHLCALSQTGTVSCVSREP